jgi:hypothetical protein
MPVMVSPQPSHGAQLELSGKVLVLAGKPLNAQESLGVLLNNRIIVIAMFQQQCQSDGGREGMLFLWES